jgi:TRAP transporter 4TM/12TM fusion protein
VPLRIGAFLKAGRRRQLSPVWKRVATAMTCALAALEFYGAPFGFVDFYLLRGMFVGFALALTFLCFSYSSSSKADTVPFVDMILAALGFSTGVYIFVNGERIITRWTGVDPMGVGDLFITATVVILVIEVTRRTVGPLLVVIIMAFVAYSFLGEFLPGMFGHRGMTLTGFLENMVYTFDGIYSAPIGVTCTYVFMFIFFGQVFNMAGGGNFFFRLASSIAGKMIGGPAKIAVIASALYGTMSGSPTSDVVTTGSITIPLMKRLGYSPVFAGAVEASASTGASLLPPIMGTAAFLMVDIAGIPYAKIAAAATIPALVYYFGIMMQVHYRAVIRNLRAIADEDQERERPWRVLKENLLYLIPIAVLVWLITKRLNPTLVGLLSACVAIMVSWFKPGYRMGPKKILEAVYKTGVGILTVANASAAAGLVIGGIMLTGLGGKFTSLVFAATGGQSLLCLIMVAVVCIILGMGMPIPAAYVLTATLAAPALLEAGFSLLTAHLFIVYFSALSAVTPPVAVAAYAGAGIAGGNPNATGFQATRLAVAAFFAPFVFMYRPALVLEGSFPATVWATVMAVLAVFAIASGLEGYLLHRVDSILKRLVLVGAGVVMFWPEVWADITGIMVLGALLRWEWRARHVPTGGLAVDKNEPQ